MERNHMIASAQTQSFPESWDAPIAVGGTFMFDPMHFPYACTPLTHSSIGRALGYGFTEAAHEYNTPIKQVHVTERNLFHFEYYEMIQPDSDDEAHRMGELAEATLR